VAVGALASTNCNNFIADLLFLSEVSHSLLVAGPACVHPYLGKWALFIVWSLVLPFNIQEDLRDMRATAFAIAPIVYRVLDRNMHRRR
jgi:hypothetical protein